MGEFCRAGIRLSLLVPLLAVASFLHAAESPRVEVGWGGRVQLGRWIPVRVEAADGETVRLIAEDPNGSEVVWTTEQSTPGWRSGLIRIGRPDEEVPRSGERFGELTVQWSANGENGRTRELVVNRTAPPASGPIAVLPPSGRLVLTVGELKGFEFAEADRVANSPAPYFVSSVASATELPTDPRGYDSVSHLVLAGPPQITAAQSAALRTWVAMGGRLILALSTEPGEFRASPLASWAPFQVAEEAIIVREVGRLEAFSGKSVRIPLPNRQKMVKVTAPAGRILAADRDDTLLTRIPYGFGTVTVLTLELPATAGGEGGKSPLLNWPALPDFCRKLVGAPLPNADDTRRGRRTGTQLSTTGITDLSSQVHAVQEHHAPVDRTTPWPTMGWMLLLIALLAAADYGIVHLILQRPHATWVTLPAMIAMVCGLSAWWATENNGVEWRSNVLEIVDVDTTTQQARVQAWVDLYSPVTTRRDLEVTPAPVRWLQPEPLEAAPWPPAVSWAGIPETSYGGMYRPAGLEFDQARYEIQPPGKLAALPWLQWSTQAVQARWSAKAASPIEGDLKFVGVGRLSGKLINSTGVPLEDWLIAYGNRCYRRLKDRNGDETIPLAGGETWDLDGGDVFQREIRSILTRTTSSIVQRKGQSSMGDVLMEQGRYDPLSLAPTDLIRLLTFHDEAGGTAYTGLTNHLLEDSDATRQLELQRAVLFARIALPLTTVTLDGTPVEPSQRSTYLRVVLPVERQGEEVRLLPKLK